MGNQEEEQPLSAREKSDRYHAALTLISEVTQSIEVGMSLRVVSPFSFNRYARETICEAILPINAGAVKFEVMTSRDGTRRTVIMTLYHGPQRAAKVRLTDEGNREMLVVSMTALWDKWQDSTP